MDHKPKSLIVGSAVFILLLLPLRLPFLFWQILILTAFLGSISLFWILDEKPNVKRFLEDWFVILFLFIFIISLGLFSYLLPHPAARALVLGSTGFFVYYILQVSSRIKRGYTPSLFLRNIITVASTLLMFFSVSNIFKFTMVYSERIFQILAIVSIFLITFLVCEFLFEIQGYKRPVLYSLVISFLISQICWFSSYWVVSYPQSEHVTNVGLPLPAIIVSIYFYLFWGIAHHRLEGNLTRKVLWEYIIIAISFLLILVLTANWIPSS